MTRYPTTKHDSISMNTNASNQPSALTDAATFVTLHEVENLIARASILPPVPTAVVHPCDRRSLGDALNAREAGIITPVLVAPEARLRAVAEQAWLDLAGCEIVDVPHSHAAAACAAQMAGRGEVRALMKGSLYAGEYLGAIIDPAAGLRTVSASSFL